MRVLRNLTAIHMAANAAILWCGYYWLGLGESRAAALAWSAAVALLFLAAVCWHYGAILVHFRPDRSPGTLFPWKRSLRNIAPLLAAAILMLAIYILLARWEIYSQRPAFNVASWLTLHLKRPVRPSTVKWVLDTVLLLVQWLVVPGLFLPMLSSVAWRGWRGFRAIGALAGRWFFLLEAAVLLGLGVATPLKLIAWVPRVNGFGMEAISFLVRAALAYLLFTAAGLLLARVTSGGSPRFTQLRTAPAP